MRTFSISFFLFFCSLSLLQAQYQVSGAFSSPSVEVGREVSYSIIISRQGRGNLPQPDISWNPADLPEVQGLEFNWAGPGQNTRIINGRMQQSISLNFRALPRQPGEYTMPGFTITIDGQPYEVAPATLRVVQGSQTAILELELPRDYLYVGEAVPFTLKIRVREGIQASILGDGFPEKEGEAFALETENVQRSQPARTEVDGSLWNTITWQGVLTPLKTGQHPLSFALPLEIQEPRSRRRSPFDGFFSDGQVVHLFTPEQNVEVRALPEEGRNRAFTGGIGLFSIALPKVSRSTVQVGEPLTLELTLEGTGNFDRLSAPPLEDSEDWRSYPPEARFEASDNFGLQGRKTFAYTMVPQRPGRFQTPNIPVSFFNPEVAEYVSLELPGVSVEVTGEPAPALPQTAPAEPETAPMDSDGYLPPLPEPGPVHSLRPGPSPLWWAAATLLLVGTAAMGWRRWQHLQQEKHPTRIEQRRRRQQAAECLQKMDTHLPAKDLAALALSYCRWWASCQEPLREPEALTATEITACFAGLAEPRRQQLAEAGLFEILQQAEALRYGAAAPDIKVDLPNLKPLLEALPWPA